MYPLLPWRCPVCGCTMSQREKNISCENHHSFDIAKEGYVHLLSTKKHGASIPGDNADMVHARTAFLEAGYYEAFSNGIQTFCADALSVMDHAAPLLADAGCGEGYYTNRLCRYLRTIYHETAIAGFDVSKTAIRHGAKAAQKQGLSDCIAYSVASLFEMPLRDTCVDGIVNIFAPVAEKEFLRVLRNGGFLIMAVPAERHLWGLKQALYDTPYENELRRDSLTDFTLTEIRRIAYEINVSTQTDMQALFHMTPYVWKTSPSDMAKLTCLDTLTTEVAFDLLLYRKSSK